MMIRREEVTVVQVTHVLVARCKGEGVGGEGGVGEERAMLEKGGHGHSHQLPSRVEGEENFEVGSLSSLTSSSSSSTSSSSTCSSSRGSPPGRPQGLPGGARHLPARRVRGDRHGAHRQQEVTASPSPPPSHFSYLFLLLSLDMGNVQKFSRAGFFISRFYPKVRELRQF